MPVIDPAAIVGILSDLAVSILSYAGIAVILYNIGGILIRTVSWFFDRILINFIGFFYKYFETIINGTLLTDSVVRGMMDRVYLLVGVFVAFRLGMLLVNYVINPSEVMDEKVGVNALVKRVILGLILIIFMPNIFNFAFKLQEAVLKDQVIERVIMPENEMAKVMKYKEKHGMGKIIGMTVFRGFFNLSDAGKSSSKVKTNFDKATDIEQTYDLSIIEDLSMGGTFNRGVLAQNGDTYVHDYFPIFSTVVLGYVLYLLVQYCLDAVVRSFKLSVLQVIAPIAIVEYMINSDRNEVFKSWKKAVVATFAMLFMRVASLWFVAYVTMLMQPGATDSTSLLQTGDNLLKAIIVLGLLAFMMDFPKMMSDIFGLDLDQSGSVKSVMGKAMGAATAGLALGGAVAGFGMKTAGAVKGTVKGGLTNLAGKESSFAKGLNNPFKTAAGQVGALAGKIGGKASEVGSAFKAAATDNKLGTTLKSGAMVLGGAVLASNQFTKSMQGGYQQTAGAVDSKVKNREEKEQEQAYRNATLNAQAQVSADLSKLSSDIQRQMSHLNLQGAVDIAGRIKAQNPTFSQNQVSDAIVNVQMQANSSAISNQISNLAGTMDVVAGSYGGAISDVTLAVNTVSNNLQSAGISEATIQQTVNQIKTDYSAGSTISSSDASRIINDAHKSDLKPLADQASKFV